MPRPKLVEIPGVGPAAAHRLTASGFADVDSVADARPESLAEIHGFSLARATRIIAAARALIGDPTPESESKAPSRDAEMAPPADERATAADTRRDRKKRGKKDKKRKKKEKKKGKKKEKKGGRGKGKGKDRKKKHKKKRRK